MKTISETEPAKKIIVSVIVVNHNGKEYLLKCLGSILANNFIDYEIIVVDNSSSDGSISFIQDKLGTKLHNLVVLELKQNFGPALSIMVSSP